MLSTMINSRCSLTAERTGVMVFDVVHRTFSGEMAYIIFLY